MYAESQYPGGGYGAALVHPEFQVPPASDEARFENAGFVRRPLQFSFYRSGAVLGVAGNANVTSAEALDSIVAIPGLHVYEGPGRQALAIHKPR